jgi:hypothetical protein
MQGQVVQHQLLQVVPHATSLPAQQQKQAALRDTMQQQPTLDEAHTGSKQGKLLLDWPWLQTILPACIA